VVVAVVGCEGPEGLAEATEADVTVAFTFGWPLRMPLPNDLLTRIDPTATSGVRLNLPFEPTSRTTERLSEQLDRLDGWGLSGSITIPFSADIDIEDLLARHPPFDTDPSDDAIVVIDIDERSAEYGRAFRLDPGNGEHPEILGHRDAYGTSDVHADDLTVLFSELDEDRNGNGRLDPGEDDDRDGLLDAREDRNGNGRLDPPEDRDGDGILDVPNWREPSDRPTTLAERADALLTGYDRESHSLFVRPAVPFREHTRYAVLVTRRVIDLAGHPVGSPFPFIHHAEQAIDLESLVDVLPSGLSLTDIAFAFSFTTQSVTQPWIELREGLRGVGPKAGLGTSIPATITSRSTSLRPEQASTLFQSLVRRYVGVVENTEVEQTLVEAQRYIDVHVMGTFASAQPFEPTTTSSVWPEPLTAPLDPVDVPFWLALPRPEVLGERSGALPCVILLHDLGSSRLEVMLEHAGHWAGQGFAVVAIDLAAHGPAVTDEDRALFRGLLGPSHRDVADALALARTGVRDIDGDGRVDSGAGAWTYDPFHNRDVLRQSVLDIMQFIRILDSFDGQRTWTFETEAGGSDTDGLAGDFDGDGQIDLGRASAIHVVGWGEGANVATLIAALEPRVDTVVAVGGGARLADLQFHSSDPLRIASVRSVIGPSFLLTVFDSGITIAHAEFPERNGTAEVPFRVLVPPTALGAGGVPGIDIQIRPGDTVVAEIPFENRRRCGYVHADDLDDGVAGRARIDLPSDRLQAVSFRIYRGPVLADAGETCSLVADAPAPVVTLQSYSVTADAAGDPITYEGRVVVGPLLTLSEGLGTSRASERLRSYRDLAQIALDVVDPGVFARHLDAEPIRYPELDDATSARALWIAAGGDIRHPLSHTVALAEAAGHLDLDFAQSLEASDLLEGVATLQRRRYGRVPDSELVGSLLGIDPSLGVLVDVQQWGADSDPWGGDVPRTERPTDPWRDPEVQRDGGLLVPYALPSGLEAFPLAGDFIDRTLALCRLQFGAFAEPCEPSLVSGHVYDFGWALIHVMTDFVQERVAVEPLGSRCWDRDSCDRFPPLPPTRP